MVEAETYKVLPSGQVSVPAGANGGLLDGLLPADAHYAAVAAEEDPDLRTS